MLSSLLCRGPEVAGTHGETRRRPGACPLGLASSDGTGLRRYPDHRAWAPGASRCAAGPARVKRVCLPQSAKRFFHDVAGRSTRARGMPVRSQAGRSLARPARNASSAAVSAWPAPSSNTATEFGANSREAPEAGGAKPRIRPRRRPERQAAVHGRPPPASGRPPRSLLRTSRVTGEGPE